MTALEGALVRIAELEKENEKLKEEIKQLKIILQEKVYGARPGFRKPPVSRDSGKKPGRPEGHEGSSRPTPETVDETVEKKLCSCPDCGHKVAEICIRERTVEDIIPAKIHVKKIVIHEYYCKHCKEKKEAPVTEAFPNCRLGLSIYLLVVFLKMKQRLPYKQIKNQLKIAYGINVSEAELYLMNLRVALEFGEKYGELMERLRNSPSVNIDETSWRTAGQNRWLWAFISDGIALYHIDEKRNQKVVKRFIGEDYGGVVTTDFLSTYGRGLNCKKQKCLVHLKRRLKEKAERKESNSDFHSFREKLLTILKDAESFPREEKDILERTDAKAAFEDRIEEMCKMKWKDRDCLATIRTLRKNRKDLFTFLLYPGIKPDNNAAERGIRPNVVIRKISYGNRGENGSFAHSINMSIVETCNLNNQNFLDWSKEYFEQRLLK